MSDLSDRIWAAAQTLNATAETDAESAAINDLLAVANALRAAPPSDPAAPLDVECPHCDVRHEWPCPTIPRCDQQGCDREATCGWPTPSGLAYRRTCGEHYRALSGSRGALATDDPS